MSTDSEIIKIMDVDSIMCELIKLKKAINSYYV